jgi:hypothetical protein
VCVGLLADLSACLLALDTRLADAGGRFVAPDNLHPSCHPLVYHANNVVGIEVPKPAMPGIDGGPGSGVISDQHGLRRILTLSGKMVKNRNMG